MTVTVDRPMGSFHPKHKELFYPVNYGYIKGILARDGKEQDAYLLGVQYPVSEFTGTVIAIVKRKNDTEDKWVVAPADCHFQVDEIQKQIAFQEKYFQIEIIVQ